MLKNNLEHDLKHRRINYQNIFFKSYANNIFVTLRLKIKQHKWNIQKIIRQRRNTSMCKT